jgi:hypothetical protein
MSMVWRTLPAFSALLPLLAGLAGLVAAPEQHDLRLVDGVACVPGCSEGLLEIYEGGQWQGICDDSWDSAGAEVACRQLGMRGGRAYHGPASAEAAVAHSYSCGDECSRTVWQSEPSCDGSEATLAACPRANRAVSCGTAQRAGLHCTSGPSVLTLVAIAVNGAAVVAALAISCRLAIKRAQELKRLDTVSCADIVRSWVVVVRAAPRACLCCCCSEKPAGGGYGKPKRKKIAVRQAGQAADAAPPADASGGRGNDAPDVEVAAAQPPELGAPNPAGPSEPPPSASAGQPEAPEAKGLRRPLSAGGAERRAAVAQRWIQEGLVSTGPEPKRPAELIAEARGEAPEDGSAESKRNRRKSNVTDTWLAQSESAVVPIEPGLAGSRRGNVPLDPLEPAAEAVGDAAAAGDREDSYGDYVAGGQSEVRLGEEADPILGGATAGMTSIT